MTARKKSKRRILVVDDDESLCRLAEYNLGRWGYESSVVHSGSEMYAQLAQDAFDVILLDVRLPDGEGTDFIPDLKDKYPHCEVVMVTANGSVDMAMDAIRMGAFDFHTKPVDLDRLEVSVRNAVRLVKSREESDLLKQVVDGRDHFGSIIGVSPAMQTVYEIISNVAESDCSVLITGETGCGKELVAAEIHRRSRRRMKEMVTVNSAAIPRELLESEMFGHEKGAFTGATQRKTGCAERANQSTLFLDEIGEMPMELQAKMLRFLQDKKFTRLGGSEEIASDIRVVSATNRDPAQAIEDGLLREDLLYRINVVKIPLPPLRERREDIPLLADAFLKRFAEEHGKTVNGFDDDAMAVIRDCGWPGNVRQLANVVQETVVLNRAEVITAAMLPAEVREAAANSERRKLSRPDARPYLPVQPLWQLEKEAMQRALLACAGNVTEAAKRLEISRAKLYRKIKEYELNSPGAEG